MKYFKGFAAASLLVALCGCATTSPPPLSYLSLEKPKGTIQTAQQQDLKKSFSRGGMYFFNYNFRPAADLGSYIEQAQKETSTSMLRNADIRLNVPFALDILFFGYNHAEDSLSLKTVAEAKQ